MSSSTIDPSVWVTILAGGVGSRFWPVSTPARPKQLLPLAGDRPLIEDTLARARRLVPDERIRILAGADLTRRFIAALPDLHESAYLVEPEARGTAPVLAWAAWTLLRTDPDACLVSLHADHKVDPEEAFTERLRDAAILANRERILVTIGARPDRPETGYGYVQPGEALPAPPAGAARVRAFHEKPDRETADRYLTEGFLWNTGIFVWRADVFLEEVRAHAPEVAAALPHLEAGDVDAFFAACTPVTVDVAVLERSHRVGVLPATFEWDDVGSWASLARTRPADASGNVALGRTVAVESRDNVVFAEGGAVVLYGVDDLIVVRTGGVTFVTSRGRAPELKELVSALPPDLKDPDA